mmetsp:Transcript_4168/g.15462  ORF Transcript_4168/g.15462 Transcript_4168/m.15462 type:complete len:304 (+) Transcript_4168:2954-3865(+)
MPVQKVHRRVRDGTAVIRQRKDSVLRLDEFNLCRHLRANLKLMRSSPGSLALLELGGGKRLGALFPNLCPRQRRARTDVDDTLAPGHVEDEARYFLPFSRMLRLFIVAVRVRELMERNQTDRIGVHIRHVHEHTVFSHGVDDALDFFANFKLFVGGGGEETLGCLGSARGALIGEPISDVNVRKDGPDQRRLRGHPRRRRHTARREGQGKSRGLDGCVHRHNSGENCLAERKHLLRVNAASDWDISELRGRCKTGETAKKSDENSGVSGCGRDVTRIDGSDDRAADVFGKRSPASSLDEGRFS